STSIRWPTSVDTSVSPSSKRRRGRPCASWIELRSRSPPRYTYGTREGSDPSMSDQVKQPQLDGFSRRRMFDAVALASLGLAAAGSSEAAPADETKFEPLPNFKFNIENQRGWQGEAGSAKEATVAEFPISQSIAGVSMRLKPGSIRELHWHSLAAEWA